MGNIYRISIVRIITTITIHLHLACRYLGTTRPCHVGWPHLYLFSVFIRLVEYKASPFFLLSLSFAVSFIVTFCLNYLYLQLVVRFLGLFLEHI